MIFSFFSTAKNTNPNTDTIASSIHEFEIQALNSNDKIRFKDFEGKKILIVNVASKCGFTKQYADLEKLYQEFKDELVIIGFPCNQFGGQESGSEEEIAKFCSLNYGVTFPITTKVNVKGNEQHAIYSWLTKKDLNGVSDYSVKWNFNKFLINEEGELIDKFDSRTKPYDQAITQYLN